MKKLIFLLLPLAVFGSDIFYYHYGKKVYLKPLETTETRTTKENKTLYFRNSIGNKIGVSTTILAKPYSNVMIIDIENSYSVKFVKNVTSKIMKFQAKTPEDAIAISNKMVEDGVVIYAHPNFITEKRLR